MYMVGFMVSRKSGAMTARSSFDSAVLRAGLPVSSTSLTLFNADTSRTASLSPVVWASLACLEIWRSTASRSARASSVLMVSMSDTGSILPATCTTFGSSKQRTTCAMASVSRMLARNLLPRPSPLDAPATRPAMSTNSTTAGTTFCGCSMPAMTSRRRSGTGTMPTFGSMVQNG